MNSSKKQGRKFEPKLYGKSNLIIFIISLILLIIGYALMAGGTSPDGVSFNEAVFSITRIRIAPFITTLGYVGILLAILYKGKTRE